jgi:hypothetical protein
MGLRLRLGKGISVPQTIEVDKVEAELKNGILKLHLPKSEAVKPRQIEIRLGYFCKACTAQTIQGSKDRITCPASTGLSSDATAVPISASSQGPRFI